MSEKIAIFKIEIKIGNEVLKLSLAQMQELKDVLNKTFPSEKTVYVDRQPYYIPPPIYIEPPVYPWHQWITTCGDLSTTNTFYIEASQCQD